MAQRENIIAKVARILARAKSTNFGTGGINCVIAPAEIVGGKQIYHKGEVETMCKGCPWANPETCRACKCRDKQEVRIP